MVSKDVLLKVAKLARLNLTQDELEEFTKDATEVLEHFAVLAKAPVDQEQETPILPVEIDPPSREDKDVEVFCTPQAIELSTHRQDKFFKGPKAF